MTTTAARRMQGRQREELAEEIRRRVSGEVRFDPFSRVLYSTDASIYQMEPVGVVIPRDAEDILAVMEVARDNQVPVLPRSGGTSLAGPVGQPCHSHGLQQIYEPTAGGE